MSLVSDKSSVRKYNRPKILSIWNRYKVNLVLCWDDYTIKTTIDNIKFKKNNRFIKSIMLHASEHYQSKRYKLSKTRTNYGIFNIRFQGPRVWNSIEEQIKSSSLKLFKEKLKNNFLCKY